MTSAADFLLPWARRHHAAGARMLGLHGSQGSGKSTACAQLAHALTQEDGLHVVTLSIDDVYRTRAERQDLAASVHPMLETRGVPGTHDVPLARQTLHALRHAQAGDVVPVPRFDKNIDDRAAPSLHEGPIDLVLFEGWCLALPPLPTPLDPPCNDLERTQDPDGTWRRFVAQQLAGPYVALWSDLDAVAALIAPSIETVVQWRTQAESARQAAPEAIADIATFVQHYERLTRWGIDAMPNVAGLTIWLDASRQVVRHKRRDLAD